MTAGPHDDPPELPSAERRCRRTLSDEDRCVSSERMKTLISLYKNKCNAYWKSEIDSSGGDMKIVLASVCDVAFYVKKHKNVTRIKKT